MFNSLCIWKFTNKMPKEVIHHGLLAQCVFCFCFVSILSRIVHVTEDVQEYRRWVREVFPLAPSNRPRSHRGAHRSSPPASPPLPATVLPATYSYACAVKTGAAVVNNNKDLNG